MSGSKRAFDIIGSSLALIILSPLLVVVALLILVGMGPPVLFRQPRAGLHGKPFTLYKFRTMRDLVDAQGGPLPDNERMTPLGRMLRVASLDELPSLLNVLRGEMSLVGPRPLLLEYVPLYSRDQAKRLEVRPGITGWAQVNGRNEPSWEEKLSMDVWYVRNHSLPLDIKILALTPVRVLTRRGISQPGHATMPRFRGSARPERETPEQDGPVS